MTGAGLHRLQSGALPASRQDALSPQPEPITRIDNDIDLQRALQRMDELWNAQSGTPEGDELDALADLIEAYETPILAALLAVPE